MKNCIKSLALAVLALAGAWGCSKSEPDPVVRDARDGQVTIEAFLADAQATKTAIRDDGKVLWNPGDSILVFFGDYAVPFVSYNTEPSDRAFFVGSTPLFQGGTKAASAEPALSYWSVYPMQTRKAKYVPVKDGESVYAYVDAIQQGKEGTFDNSTFPTVARSEDWSQLSFYNLCGGLRFKVTARDIDVVTFRGNNGEKLAGEVSVKMDQEGHPYPAEVYSTQPELQLRAPAGEYFKPGVWYYIVALPATLSQGYTMMFISSASGKAAVRTSRESVTIKRSVFGEITDADAGLTWYDGFDMGDLEGMEDAMEVSGFYANEAQQLCLEITYHNRYLKQLVERTGIYFVPSARKTIEAGDNTYLPFYPSMEVGEGDEETAILTKLSYDEVRWLYAALQKSMEKRYLAKLPKDATDVSQVRIYKLDDYASALFFGDSQYLSSSEDGARHYFYCNNTVWVGNEYHREAGVFCLDDLGDRLAVNKVVDASTSVLLAEGSVSVSKWEDEALILAGKCDGVPMIEVFAPEGEYSSAVLEVEGYEIDNIIEEYGKDNNSYYYLVLANDAQGRNYVLVCEPIFQVDPCFVVLAELKGWLNGCRFYNNSLVVASNEGWCCIAPDNAASFQGSLDYYMWDMIEKEGRVCYLLPDYETKTVTIYNVNVDNASSTVVTPDLPQFCYEFTVYLSISEMAVYFSGTVDNHSFVDVSPVTAIFDIDAGTLTTQEGYAYPDDFQWYDHINFGRIPLIGQQWFIVGNFEDGKWQNGWGLSYDGQYWYRDYIYKSDWEVPDNFKFSATGETVDWNSELINLGSDGTGCTYSSGKWIYSLEPGGSYLSFPENRDSSDPWCIQLDVEGKKAILYKMSE